MSFEFRIVGGVDLEWWNVDGELDSKLASRPPKAGMRGWYFQMPNGMFETFMDSPERRHSVRSMME